MNENPTEKQPAASASGVPAGTRRKRLRMQPLARDNFTNLVYAGVVLLLFIEFIALFWLDLFD